MWTTRLKALSTWMLALTSGTVLAVGAAIVTSGSLATSPASNAVASTSTVPAISPTTDLSGTHHSTTSVADPTSGTQREAADHVGATTPTTLAPYKGYDDNENEQHYGEHDEREWDDD